VSRDVKLRGPLSAFAGRATGPLACRQLAAYHGATMIRPLVAAILASVAATAAASCAQTAPTNTPVGSTTTATTATAAPTTTPATTDTSSTSSDGDAGTAAATPEAAAPAGPTASATLDSKSGTTITGTAQFVESNGGVVVTVNVKGAAPGDHGVHLHETPDCSSADAKSAGGHWNPDNMQHGGPTSPSHHAGDFGNITVGADGTGTLTLTMPGLTVAPGTHSVVGHAIVVHANADDLKSQTPTPGNAGARGACGVIAAASN
jgi:Cu-Zn family superoxide dismutase